MRKTAPDGTHRILIRGTKDEYLVRDQVFPVMEVDQFTGMPITYHHLIVVDEHNNPTHFLVVMPTDIVTARFDYSDEIMEQMNAAADEARDRHEAMKQAREEYAEEEVVSDEMSTEDYHGYN